MFRTAQSLCNAQYKFSTCIRNLSSSEVSTALRPFYFSVHPDLFGQYPNQREINENSLQQLSSVLATLQAQKFVKPTNLKFYIKNKTQTTVSFRMVQIHIQGQNIRNAVLSILKSCELPTDYIDNIAETPKSQSSYEKVRIKTNDIDLTKVHKDHPIFAHIIFDQKIKEAREALKLKNWLHKHYKEAIEKYDKHKPYREEVHRLSKHICEDLGLKEIRWDCGWNDSQFRGCLLSFKALADQNPCAMHILKGRNLVFSHFTGVSLDGDVMLFIGEVRYNWLDLIKNIKKYDAVLLRIPAFEKSVSHVLRNIKVGRRKFMPKIVAGEYERNLQHITTSLSDYVAHRPYPKQWPDSLEGYEIVVETEAGPLMVSPTGQFIVPSTIPGALLVNFITTNLEDATRKINSYKHDKHMEKSLHKLCLNNLLLEGLQKDDNVTPELMIKCCQKLIEHKFELEKYLKGINLNIATYYSVLSDGMVCIPWNWKL